MAMPLVLPLPSLPLPDLRTLGVPSSSRTVCWDKRGLKNHRASKEQLGLSNSEPAQWDAALPRGIEQGPNPGSTVEALVERCEDAELGEAVDALEVLVQQRGCRVSTGLLYRVLKRCVARKDLVLGRRVHGLIVLSGYECNAFLANHMIGMYACHGKLEEAVQVFTQVSSPDVYMWSSIIFAHTRHGQPREAISLYRRIREAASVEPDNRIFVAALTACASAHDLGSGKQVHADVRASGGEGDIFVATSLLNMYAKCGSLGDARKVFDSLPRRDVVAWNTMMAGYTQQGLGREALTLHASMEQEGTTRPDHVTFVCLLQACASLGALEEGKQLHLQIRERGLEADVFVGSCLVDMYSKCGRLEDAREVFDRLPTRNVVTWTAMLAAYSKQGLGREALALYASMQREGITPSDRVAYVCLLQACASVGALQQGQKLHSQIQDIGLEADGFIASCLVDMYAKCGSLEHAHKVFHSLPRRDVVTWNALLNGYAEHSDGETAIRSFEQMLEDGVKPNETSFLCLLAACSHSGLVHEGRRYFKMMVEDCGIVPTDSHYNCMVDLLGRSGKLDEAEHLLQTTSFLDKVVGWTALLTACKSHGDVERGRRCFEHLVELRAEEASPYTLLGNIYANAGRWDDVDRIERLRKSAGARKKPAKACIEVKSEVHEFTVGEDRCDISSKVRSMNMRLKEEGGHVPQTHLVLRPISEDEKEDALCGHAEKLALAYGLLNTPDGTTLLVTKNLRMCNDCHNSSKIMSHVEKREIIVRDAHRVHRFQNGSCSCGDGF